MYEKTLHRIEGEVHMNMEPVKGTWKQVQDKVQERWSQQINDELTFIAGHREKLTRLILERSGYQTDGTGQSKEDFFHS